METTTEERNWGAEAWRAPELQPGDVLLFSECGRIVKAGTYGHGGIGIDYRSHYFRVVKAEYGGCFLLVRHGGGQERIKLDYGRALQFFDPLDSTERYLLLHMLYSVHRRAAADSTTKTADTYKRAFVEGRLRKRKTRGADSVKVWIES